MAYVAAMLAAALLAFDFAFAREACPDSDRASLLQRQTLTGIIPSRRKVPRAVAFEGNGQLAESDYAAVLAGLLAVSQEEKGTANLSTLLEVFDYFSSNSGGTWYSGMLAFSDKVRSAQEKMGSLPQKAGEIWNEEVLSREDLDAFEKAADVSWYDAVAAIKKTSAGLLGNITLGNVKALQSWATGKIWLVGVSLPTGSGDQPIRVNSTLVYSLGQQSDPSWIPAVISAKLDENTKSATSPLPFCNGYCKSLKMVHYGGCESSSDFDPVQVFSHPGRLLFTGVLTSSSAYNAAADIGNGSSGTTMGQASWVEPGTIHPILSGEEAVVYHGIGADVCKSFALGDGAYTDNTGIAHAVAAGADVVTAFLNGYKLEGALSALSSDSGGVFQESIAEKMQTSHEKRVIVNETTQNNINITFVRVNTTTQDNQLFNVSQGRRVQLNLILIEGFDDETWAIVDLFGTFGELVQVLVDSMTASENRETVKWVLSSFFGQN